MSQGIGTTWDFRGHGVVAPTICIEINTNGRFYTPTFERASSTDTSVYPRYCIECQTGTISDPLGFRKLQLLFGGGGELPYPSSGKGKEPLMRISLFTGFMVFIDANTQFTDTVSTDVDEQIVLLIPLTIAGKGSLGGSRGRRS